MNLLKKYSLKIKLLALVGLLSFTLISTTVATVCWFTATRKVTQEGTVAVIKRDAAIDFTLTQRVLKFNDNAKTGEEAVASTSGAVTLKLDSYDCFIPGRNDYLSQLIEIKIKSNEDTTESSQIIVTLECNGAYLDSSATDTVANNMSNVMNACGCLYSYKMKGSSSTTTVFTMGTTNRFKKSKDPSSTATYTGNDQIYQEVRYQLSTLPNVYTKNTFVSEASVAAMPAKGESGYSKGLSDINAAKAESDKKITFNITKPNGQKLCLPSGFTEATFYVQIDYSKTLADFYCMNRNATFIDGQSSIDPGAVSLVSDITKLTVALEG